ncbi:hypothetical protein P7C70_g6492, partial [Phenoliferia sp. Uapishka_3]
MLKDNCDAIKTEYFTIKRAESGDFDDGESDILWHYRADPDMWRRARAAALTKYVASIYPSTSADYESTGAQGDKRRADGAYQLLLMASKCSHLRKLSLRQFDFGKLSHSKLVKLLQPLSLSLVIEFELLSSRLSVCNAVLAKTPNIVQLTLPLEVEGDGSVAQAKALYLPSLRHVRFGRHRYYTDPEQQHKELISSQKDRAEPVVNSQILPHIYLPFFGILLHSLELVDVTSDPIVVQCLLYTPNIERLHFRRRLQLGDRDPSKAPLSSPLLAALSRLTNLRTLELPCLFDANLVDNLPPTIVSLQCGWKSPPKEASRRKNAPNVIESGILRTLPTPIRSTIQDILARKANGNLGALRRFELAQEDKMVFFSGDDYSAGRAHLCRYSSSMGSEKLADGKVYFDDIAIMMEAMGKGLETVVRTW